ncbi:uncharacterized protein [Magallana gigas]|uniref:uncharacterized protein n=1 Tax=Magallana gigas TaxID=29159 RepID=UPI0033426553
MCHIVKGTCFECKPGWIGILCETNDLSYKQIASQLHTFPGVSYDAGNAVDRDLSTCMRTREIGFNSSYKTVWWKVDFGGVYNIYSINIVFRSYNGSESRQRGRFAGFSLYVSVNDVSTTSEIKNSTLCYKDETHLPPLNFTAICASRGRYVIFYNERVAGVSYPAEYQVMDVLTELCEVVVQGCKMPGVYGSKCDNLCPINCKDSTCHVENGTCFGCKPGWIGTSCDMKCTEGLYGFNCSRQCKGHCRETIPCNHVTGMCDEGCAAGWVGMFCEEACQRGLYGTNCSLSCSPNCKTCRPTDGLCSCKEGWMGHNCSDECIQSYGENCQYPCSGQCINRTCDRFNGNCWCDFKHDNLRNFETTDAPSTTVWIVAFSLSLVIHIIFISATLISRRKTLLKRKSTTDNVEFAWRSGSNTVQTASTDNPSHYQELRVLKDDNAYQTLQ